MYYYTYLISGEKYQCHDLLTKKTSLLPFLTKKDLSVKAKILQISITFSEFNVKSMGNL